MNWHNLHPAVKVFIWCILFSMIAGGIGRILHKFFAWRRQRDAQQKTDASEPIDYIPIDFGIYDSKGRIKRNRVELEESMKKWRKEG